MAAAALVAAPLAVSAPDASATSSSAGAASQALNVYNHMTVRQRVGQLFMIGVPTAAPSHSLATSLRRDDADNVYLTGTSGASAAGIARDTASLSQVLTQHGVKPFIGTDQEGGYVQRLHGPGFSRIPTQLAQGRLTSTTLQRRAHGWAGQLRRAGLTMNLAPVADTVPASIGTRNQPIGSIDREFGSHSGTVRRAVSASVTGWESNGIAATLKHFPGLGRASGNTDTAPHVTDPTRANDAYLHPFADGIAAGAQFVMTSSAFYPHIDAAHQACFSSEIITKLLRHNLHFDGIVISDSFGARSLTSVRLSQRGVRFIEAGGTMILDSAVSQLHSMATGIRNTMKSSAHFTALVKTAVLHVLTMKARDHLL